MPTLVYGDREIPYTLKTSRRRTLVLQITSQREVSVRAPHRLPLQTIDRFIQERGEWLVKKLEHLNDMARRFPPKTYVQGEEFWVAGQSVRLNIIVGPSYRRSHVDLADGKLIVHVTRAEHVRVAVARWYKFEAERQIREAIGHLSPQLGVTPERIAIGNQKRRWGSCSSRGHLRFNWRLAMMPPAVLDYVVVHELAHMKAHNHSKYFWSLVKSVIPNFSAHRVWLRQNSPQFSVL